MLQTTMMMTMMMLMLMWWWQWRWHRPCQRPSQQEQRAVQELRLPSPSPPLWAAKSPLINFFINIFEVRILPALSLDAKYISLAANNLVWSTLHHSTFTLTRLAAAAAPGGELWGDGNWGEDRGWEGEELGGGGGGEGGAGVKKAACHLFPAACVTDSCPQGLLLQFIV